MKTTEQIHPKGAKADPTAIVIAAGISSKGCTKWRRKLKETQCDLH